MQTMIEIKKNNAPTTIMIIQNQAKAQEQQNGLSVSPFIEQQQSPLLHRTGIDAGQ